MAYILSKRKRKIFQLAKGGKTKQEGVGDAILITKCPIRNLFAKKMLMLYNRSGYGTVLIAR